MARFTRWLRRLPPRRRSPSRANGAVRLCGRGAEPWILPRRRRRPRPVPQPPRRRPGGRPAPRRRRPPPRAAAGPRALLAAAGAAVGARGVGVPAGGGRRAPATSAAPPRAAAVGVGILGRRGPGPRRGVALVGERLDGGRLVLGGGVPAVGPGGLAGRRLALTALGGALLGRGAAPGALLHPLALPGPLHGRLGGRLGVRAGQRGGRGRAAGLLDAHELLVAHEGDAVGHR